MSLKPVLSITPAQTCIDTHNVKGSALHGRAARCEGDGSERHAFCVTPCEDSAGDATQRAVVNAHTRAPAVHALTRERERERESVCVCVSVCECVCLPVRVRACVCVCDKHKASTT